MSDLQSDVAISNGAITGTLAYVSSGSLVDTWGAGNFIALTFTASEDDTTASKYYVGLNPSVSSGLVQLDSDMDGVFKVTDPNNQWLVVETHNSDSSHVTRQTYSLSGLTCEAS